jgi:hypothetical protein
VVDATPLPLYPRERDAVLIIREAVWVKGPGWIDAKNIAPTGIRSPDRPARSESLCWLHYLCPLLTALQILGTTVHCSRRGDLSPGDLCKPALMNEMLISSVKHEVYLHNRRFSKLETYAQRDISGACAVLLLPLNFQCLNSNFPCLLTSNAKRCGGRAKIYITKCYRNQSMIL